MTRRFFLCTGECVTLEQLDGYRGSHILGELRYVQDEGRKVTALAVWEVSVPAAEEERLFCYRAVRVRVEIVGDARRIRCTHRSCAREQRWEIGKAAFMVLMQRYEKKVAT